MSNAGCLICLCYAAVRVNETDTFADEEGLNDEYFDFEDISGMVVWCYLLVQLTHAVGFGRAHFLTSCVLLQRSSSTMNTSCIASEEWSAPALFKLITSLFAAVLLICLTFCLAFIAVVTFLNAVLNSFVCACVSQHNTHWSEPATSFQS